MKTIIVPTLSKITPPEPMLEHAIRLRAYELYAQHGTAEGHAVHDWLAAEAELLDGHYTTAAALNQKSKRCGKLTEGGHKPVWFSFLRVGSLGGKLLSG